MQDFEELPADAQIEPIPEGFEALPDDAQIEPALQTLDPETYRKRLMDLIASGADRPKVDAFLQSQGIDPAAATGIDEAIAGVKQGRGLNVHIMDGQTQAGVNSETIGQALYRGVGDVAAGVGDVLGLVGNPINAGINAIAGTNLSTDLGETLRNATGAPKPVTNDERLYSGIARGATAGLATAGAAGLAAPAAGMTGYVASRVAAAPVIDTISGGTGAIGAEYGGRAAGTPGAIVGGLAGGVAGASAAARLASRLPAELAVTSSGRLTPDAHELALRNGVDEDDLLETYARARRVSDRRPLQERQAAREAVRNTPRTPEQQEAIAAIPLRDPQAPVAPPNLNAQTEALESGIAQRANELAPSDDIAPATPQGRFNEAQSEGVRLTRGQSEQDFEVQNDENSLRVSATGEGEQARSFFRQQQESIQGAIERFRSNFGQDAGTAADRGEQLKEAVKTLRDSGKAGVNELYRQAEELGGEALPLKTDGIMAAANKVFIDEAVEKPIKRTIAQELARYGIIGDALPTNEAGITKVKLRDGSTVEIDGPVKPLTAANADTMRKAINRLYLKDDTRASQAIKPAIDDALEEAIENAATREGGIGDAYKAARSAHQQQRATYNAKDIIENLTAVKKGTQTDVLLPEKAIAQVIGAGANGVSNLRRVKSLLLNSSHPTSQTAWRAIQHQGLANIFDEAISRNVNNGSGQIGDVVSGAKLNSAIRKFGPDKLRELLDPQEFNGLMKLQRIIGNATIPISGTVNPSGTATKIINYMRQGTLRFAGHIPMVGGAVNAFAGLAAKGKEIAATRRTLEGMTNYDGRVSTSKKLDEQARDFVRDYVDSGKSGALVPTSINLSNAGQPRNEK